MTSLTLSVALVILVVTAVVAAGLSLLARSRFSGLASLDTGPWASTLSYVATSYGVVLGFSILFLFGEFAAARSAIGDEATSIGTAFDEAQLFPENQIEIEHALICYARAVSVYDWPALQERGSSPIVGEAYREMFTTLSEITVPGTSAFAPATATNLVAQLGNISTARETRIVAAKTRTPPLLALLLVFGALLVVALLFVVTLAAHPAAQAGMIGLSAVFTMFMLIIVLALSTPFSAGAGRLSPALIDDTTVTMQTNSPEAAAIPCTFEDRS